LPKTLRILCATVLAILIGCGTQGEATVSTAAHIVPKVDPISATTSTTSTTTTTTSLPISTTTTIAPTTTTATVYSDSGNVSAAATSANESWPWDQIAECESGSDWGSTKNGYYEGGLQFDPGTWQAYVADGRTYGLSGYPSHAYDASREQQITVAIRVRDGVEDSSSPYLNPQGYGAWPHCRHAAGV
jgi:hypothetical protein